jgi:hypothetical protein
VIDRNAPELGMPKNISDVSCRFRPRIRSVLGHPMGRSFRRRFRWPVEGVDYLLGRYDGDRRGPAVSLRHARCVLHIHRIDQDQDINPIAAHGIRQLGSAVMLHPG